MNEMEKNLHIENADLEEACQRMENRLKKLLRIYLSNKGGLKPDRFPLAEIKIYATSIGKAGEPILCYIRTKFSDDELAKFNDSIFKLLENSDGITHIEEYALAGSSYVGSHGDLLLEEIEEKENGQR